MSNLSILKKIDPKQLYRLFIDGRFYTSEHGWENYEKREPGSIEGMSLAYSYMVDNFDLKYGIDINYLCKLHDLTISKIAPRARKNRYPGEIRQFRVSFLLKPRTCSIDGLNELIEKRGMEDSLKDCEANNYKDVADVYKRVTKGEKVRYAAPMGKLSEEIFQAMVNKSPEETYQRGRKIVQKNITQVINEIIEEYNDKIDFIPKNEKPYFLVDIVKRLIRVHPFVDANARVFISILLNHLLMYHGFFPTILEEPSIFDARTTDEILIEIKIGQNLVKQLIKEPHSRFYGHSIDDENEEHHKQILELMSKFIKKIESIN